MLNNRYIYKTLGPDAEVRGQAMLAFVDSINYSNFVQILAKHGLSQIDPEEWYPQQVWLDVFNDITNNNNADTNMVSIGMKIADHIILPPGMEELPFLDFMRGYGNAYPLNNRGKHIGYIQTEVVNEQHVIMHDATPYPDNFVYGAYYGSARRFLPRGTQITAYFDKTTPRREEGGKETLVHLRWE